MSKVNTFFNAFGDGKKTGSTKSFGGSDTDALNKLTKAIDKLISELNALIARKTELEAKVKAKRLRSDALPSIIRNAETLHADDKKVNELKDELRQTPRQVEQLLSIILSIEKDINEMKESIRFSQTAVDAYRDSPVEQRDVLLKEAEATLGTAKAELSSTVAKYESDIAKNKKYLLIGLGVAVVGFLGYKFLNK